MKCLSTSVSNIHQYPPVLGTESPATRADLLEDKARERGEGVMGTRQSSKALDIDRCITKKLYIFGNNCWPVMHATTIRCISGLPVKP